MPNDTTQPQKPAKKSRRPSLVTIALVLLMLAGTFWLVITGGAFSGEGWGSLPWLLPLALGLAAAVADAFLYRYLKGYVVR